MYALHSLLHLWIGSAPLRKGTGLGSAVDKLRHQDLLCLGFAGVHQAHPLHGIAGFQFLGGPRFLRQLGHHLFQSALGGLVDLDEVRVQLLAKQHLVVEDPNDVMDIVVVGASGESTTSTARSDYSLFYEIYQDQQNYKNGQLAQIPALTGSEVTGSQFKHRYVGTSATDTVYASDLRKCKKASDVASILATAWGSTPAAVISSTASFIFDQMLQSMSSDCYKVTISSITYEVLFSYDNSYYTHCYHQTVKEYKSNGSLIRSKTDYYQAIGG